MNSSFVVSDLSGYSPFDLGTPQVLPIPSTEAAGSKKGSNANVLPGQEDFKVFIQPSVHGRRVDLTTRRIFPTVEKLPAEPHSFSLSMTYVSPDLLAHEERLKEKAKESGSTVKRTAAEQETVPSPTKAEKTKEESSRESANDEIPAKKAKVVPLTTTVAATSLPTAPPVASNQPQKRQVETALVRLSSGKVVRVPLEFLRQHQAQIREKSRAIMKTAFSSVNGVDSINSSSSGSAIDPKLSQVLRNLHPTPPHSTSQPSATASTVPNNRIPSTSNHAANNPLQFVVQRQQTPLTSGRRVVKIIGNPGPTPQLGQSVLRTVAPINGFRQLTSTQPMKLSSSLNTISRPETIRTPQPIHPQNQQSSVRIGVSGQAIPVPIRISVPNGQSLSTAIGNAASTSGKVIMLGNKTLHIVQANGHPTGSVSSPQSGVNPGKIQLAPIFNRRPGGTSQIITSGSPNAQTMIIASSSQGAPQRLIQGQNFVRVISASNATLQPQQQTSSTSAASLLKDGR